MTSSKLYKASSVKAIDQKFSEDFGLTGFDLMKRAARAVVDEVVARYIASRRVLVLCGAGNNAGDGLLVATLLADRGWPVDVVLVTDTDKYSAAANKALQACRASQANFVDCPSTIDADVLVIDALLGVGFQSPMRRGYQSVITRVNASEAAVVAVDIPSGLDPDTGLVGEACMRATLTVTFLVDKLGLHQGAGPKVAGEQVLASLGVPDELLTDFSPEAVNVLSAAPLPKRAASVHKGNFGHLLVVAGNLGYGGACVLATEAALKSGVGLLSVVSREEHRTGLMVRCPEAMFVAADDKASIAGSLEKCDAVLIGPGLGQDGWARNVLRQVLASNRPLVVDADALNLVAEGPAPKAKMIMTPHPKEAARLLGQTKVESNRLQVLEALERRYQAVIVLKGAETLVASETDISINVWANPGMATGGMGDVLGGVIGALLAQGLPRYQAACLGVAHHSRAGLLAVERVGEVALLASDVTAEIGVSLAGISHG